MSELPASAPVRGGAPELKAWLYSDGASRGNPGPAAAGWVLQDTEGRVLREQGEALGRATNNEAEYAALIRGLQEALGLGVTEIHCRADSELVVRQMLGQYKVRNVRLQECYRGAKALSLRFARFHIEHVRREHNQRADALANRALDGP
jgi:ribonuclease HI